MLKVGGDSPRALAKFENPVLSVYIPSYNDNSSSCLYILRSYAVCNVICGISTDRNIQKFA